MEWIFVARSQSNMVQNVIFCQQKSVIPLNAKGYKNVTFPMDFRGFRAIYPGREFPASAIQAENYSYNSLPGQRLRGILCLDKWRETHENSSEK